MKVMDGRAGEVLVGQDSSGAYVELQIAGGARTGAEAVNPTAVRLSRDEARRLAALILFQAGRLEGRRTPWAVPPLRRSA